MKLNLPSTLIRSDTREVEFLIESRAPHSIARAHLESLLRLSLSLAAGRSFEAARPHVRTRPLLPGRETCGRFAQLAARCDRSAARCK